MRTQIFNILHYTNFSSSSTLCILVGKIHDTNCLMFINWNFNNRPQTVHVFLVIDLCALGYSYLVRTYGLLSFKGLYNFGALLEALIKIKNMNFCG